MFELYLNFWKQATDFKTRTNRGDYWAVMLMQTLVSLCVALAFFWWLPIIDHIFSFASLLPIFAIGARRLHDIGISGWWQLLYILIIPIIVFVILYCFKSNEFTNKYGERTPETRNFILYFSINLIIGILLFLINVAYEGIK
ncbi:DUF805 domain-containing protein [Campylobacter lari]|uniref:Hypothetical membrane protein (DUF805 domain) n=2 Tax=Campylobacter lari TaxID=201 RepID=A0A0A8HVI8_CAMLA|nr:DUF805 domain-containing protein [Campylobacter lari]AJD01812.1 hypothetical membrane protein (DUF805 domain) [Campylobacter lari NCTC 11845]EAK9955258.1 DUF805 domain-containing protein [Campylobacter lari]MCV3385225.1 DUF805 domain-containing protein [Campylobacter lari]MCV3426731.1 DUF805 domain-containing protein [Campylobacter lari]MCV3500328.1 DUF805 domain-containing protein [Campylobacter lari]